MKRIECLATSFAVTAFVAYSRLGNIKTESLQFSESSDHFNELSGHSEKFGRRRSSRTLAKCPDTCQITILGRDKVLARVAKPVPNGGLDGQYRLQVCRGG